MTERTHLALIGGGLLIGLAIVGGAALCAARPLETFAFYLFAALICGSSFGCLLSRDIVRCAAWLLGALAATAGLFLLLSANFLAVVQLIAYAGGILVLIVFGIMLTTKGGAAIAPPRPREVVLATVSLALLLTGLLALLVPTFDPSGGLPAASAAATAAPADAAALGDALLGRWWLVLQMLAFLLLAVMIGAAYLARPEKK